MAVISEIKLPNNTTHNVLHKSFFGTCSTAANTAAKVVSLSNADGWILKVGTIIGVKFSNSNTASNVTLNVNSSGAKSIFYNTAVYTGTATQICGTKDAIGYYMYDGTYWAFINYSGNYRDTNTHRPINVNGTQLLGNNTTAVNFVAGTNITLTGSGSDITIDVSGGGGSVDTDGKLIIETSYMPTGTSVRVSATTGSMATQTKTAVIGTPLIFDVPSMDRYKIEAILNDAVYTTLYRTVDMGQTIYIDTLGKGTLRGIQAILDAHQESSLLDIGDEVTIKLNSEDLILQIAAINLYASHEVIFVSKKICAVAAHPGATSDVRNTEIYTTARDLINHLTDEDKQLVKPMTKYIKTSQNATWNTISDKTWLPNYKEIFGANPSPATSTPNNQQQFPLFTSATNRVKIWNSTLRWWLYDNSGTSYYLLNVNIDGSAASANSGNGGIVLCFHLTADV